MAPEQRQFHCCQFTRRPRSKAARPAPDFPAIPALSVRLASGRRLAAVSPLLVLFRRSL